MKRQARVWLASSVIVLVVFPWSPRMSLGAGSFESSNAGIANGAVGTLVPGAGSAGFGTEEACVPRGSYGTNQSESDLAVDPTNPAHLLGGAKFFFSATDPLPPSVSGTSGRFVDWSGEYQFHVGTYDLMVSKSAVTTGSALVPGYTCVDPHPFDATTDPTFAFDTAGNAYAFVLGLNFNNTINGVFVSKRTPAGVWGAPVQVDASLGRFGKGHSFDKQWIAIDTTGGPRRDSIYVIYVDFSTSVGRIKFARSTDHGATFSKPVVIGTLNSPHAATPQIAVDGRGFVYATWWGNFQGNFAGQGSLIVAVSTDGGNTFQGPFDAVDFSVATTGTPGTFDGQILQNTTFRFGLNYFFAADPHGTHVYAAENRWSTSPAQAGFYNVILHRGTFDPATHHMIWETIGRTNDNTTATDSFQPAVAADRGIVAVAWYDRRLPCGREVGYFTRPGAANYCINTAVQFYLDTGGGVTKLGANVRASGATWDPQQPGDWLDVGVGDLPHSEFDACFDASVQAQICVTFIGDYFGLALANGAAYILSISTAPQFNTTGPLAPPAYRFWNSTAQADAQKEPPTTFYQQQVLQIVPVPAH
jgi:hypothetical protein